MRYSIYIHEKPDGTIVAEASRDADAINTMFRACAKPGLVSRSLNIEMERQKKIKPAPPAKKAAKRSA